MTESDEPWQQDPDAWRGRKSGTPEVVRRVRDALPTIRHAQMLFDVVVERLGKDAVVETAAEGKRRYLYRRDGDAIVPWPLLALGVGEELAIRVVLRAPPGTTGEEPRPGEPSGLRGLCRGEIDLRDGPTHLGVEYQDDGRWRCSSTSADVRPFEPVLAALDAGGEDPVEILGRFVAGIALGRHGPARLLYPAPLPGGMAPAFEWAIRGMREALFSGRVAPTASFLVADGFAGTAIEWGTTREAALSAWRALVERVQPRPPQPARPLPRQPDRIEKRPAEGGRVSVTARTSGSRPDVDWPEFVPENTPALVVALDPCPCLPHRFGVWTRALGDFGTTVPMLLRREEAGFTWVGDQVVAALDREAPSWWPDRLDDFLGPVEVLAPLPGELSVLLPPDVSPPPPRDSRVDIYRILDEATGELLSPFSVQPRVGHGFRVAGFDAEWLRRHVFRQRWLG